MIQFFSAKIVNTMLPCIAVIGLVIAGIILVIRLDQPTALAFDKNWFDDRSARVFKLLLLLGAGMSILLSSNYVKQEKIESAEYYFLLLFATVGGMAMVSGADLIVIFLGLELMSICIYILTGIVPNRATSIEASLKYFILGSFATGFLLYGISFIYGATGTINLLEVRDNLRSVADNRRYFLMGTILLLAGFGFKIAAVPFHMWTPDVYEGAPAPVTVFMSVLPKIATFAVLIRVLTNVAGVIDISRTTLLFVVSVLTMTVGNLIALKQTSVKRMLAYSSIAHTGYLMIGLLVWTRESIAALFFYLFVYLFMNSGAFAIVILVGRREEKRVDYNDYAGLFQTHPWLTLAMTVFMLSLAGIPPTAGFMGKFYIFMSAINSEFLAIAVIGVLNSLVSVYFYLKVTVMMYMHEPEPEAETISLSPAVLFTIVVAVCGIIQLGVFPSQTLSMAKLTAAFF
jgi:NADH-quinone oxidoreductase subunit N